MTARHAGPDRYAATPAGVLGVALGILATAAAVIWINAGPRAALIVTAETVVLVFAGVVVLVVLVVLADVLITTRRRRTLSRTGLHQLDVNAVEAQAPAAMRPRLHEEA